MKKFLMVALAAVSMVWANTPEPIELMGDSRILWGAASWDMDAMGSTSRIVDDVQNPLNGVIELAPSPAVNPWASITTALGSQSAGFINLTGLASIDIIYTATGTLRLTLMSPIGQNDGTGFRRELLAAENPTPVNIPLNTIVRPDWQGVEQIDVATVLDQITGFGLTVPFGTGGSFVVSSLILNFGEDNPLGFVAVSNITGVPTTATVGTALPLTGTVAPANATNKTIAWSISPTNTTEGATITGNSLTATTEGTVIVRATIINGETETTDYTQDFSITVNPAAAQQFLITLAANPADHSMGWVNSPTLPEGWGSVDGSSQVIVAAIAADRHRFVRWEGIASTDNPLTVIVNSDTTITAVFEPTNYLQLIDWEWNSWSSFTDNFGGSRVDFDGAPIPNQTGLKVDGALVAELTLGTPEGDNWPFLGLGTWPMDFDELVSVEITYTSNRPLLLGIGLNNTGAPTSVNYNATLVPATTPTPVMLQLSQFLRPPHPPTGFDPESPDNLCLAAVAGRRGDFAGLTFSHLNYGQTVELEVISLKLIFGTAPTDCGGGSSGIISNARTARTANRIAVTGISAGNINLNVSTAGSYTIGIYSVDGRRLAQTKANLVAGANSLTVGNDLARGIAIVRVQGANASLVRRISIR